MPKFRILSDHTPKDERLPFILNTIGQTEREMPISRPTPPRWNQLIWVTRGEGLFTVDDQTYSLSAGQGIFMRNGHAHSYYGKELSSAWCTFYCTESLLDYTIGARSHIVFDVPDSLEKETAELRSLAQNNSSTLALSAAGYAYMADVLATITRETDDVVDAIRGYMKNHLTEDLSLDEIARHVGMNKYALCRYYKAHRGRSMMEDFKHVRIAYAKRLLRYSSESVEDIGRKCGFDSHSYFSLRLREICGCTPSEDRKKHW
jgi:AraC-like DNA-binding protein